MPAALRKHVWSGHGTLLDPTRAWSARRGADYVFAMSDAVRVRVPALDAAVPFAAVLAVVIAPLPLSLVGQDTAPSRDGAGAQLIETLGPRWTLLETPMALDDRRFAGLTHLNADGRRDFTDLLGKALQRALDR